MRPRSFCDTRSIRSNCFPGAGLIRSHRCKRRRCTDGGCRRPCPPCRSLALWRRKLRIRPGGAATSACPPAIRPLGNDHHDLKGIEDGEQGERSPCAGATRHPSPPVSAHQPSGQKRESRAFPPQNGVHPPRRASALLCPPCLPYIFPPQPKLPGLYRGQPGTPPAKLRRGGPAAGGSGRRAPRGGAPYKKDPLALKAARGSRTIFGSGLLSHMTLCSIIGDGELNFRVRNGVGCTLSSMATKEISGHLFESGCVARLRALGHGRLCPLPALPAGAPCHIRTSAPKCGNTTEMPLSKY